MTNHYFGGHIVLAPHTSRDPMPASYLTGVVDFPSPMHIKWDTGVIFEKDGKQVLQYGSESNRSPIPTAWLDFQLQESFWSSHRSRYGRAALRLPKVLVAKAKWWGFYNRTHSAKLIPAADLNSECQGAAANIQSMLADLRKRRRKWKFLRPW